MQSERNAIETGGWGSTCTRELPTVMLPLLRLSTVFDLVSILPLYLIVFVTPHVATRQTEPLVRRIKHERVCVRTLVVMGLLPRKLCRSCPCHLERHSWRATRRLRLVDSFFIRRGPGPNRTFPIFLSSYIKLT